MEGGPFSMVRLHGLASIVQFLNKLIYKAFGSIIRCKLNVDQEEWPCIQKMIVLNFLTYVQKGKFWKIKELKFDHSLVFIISSSKKNLIEILL